MVQEQDFLSVLIDSFRSVFASSAFRDLFLGFLAVFVFITSIRCIFHFMSIACYPSRFKHRRQVDKAEKDPSCVFHCDCDDCSYYESGKYCVRCDRFEICAYCSSRGHCNL